MDNFNLKKYLVENKVTRNSRMIREDYNKANVEQISRYWEIMIDNQPEDVKEILVKLTAGTLSFNDFITNTNDDILDSFRDELYAENKATRNSRLNEGNYNTANNVMAIINQLIEMGNEGERVLAILERIPEWNELVSDNQDIDRLNEGNYNTANNVMAIINQLIEMGDEGERVLAILERIPEWNELVSDNQDIDESKVTRNSRMVNEGENKPTIKILKDIYYFDKLSSLGTKDGIDEKYHDKAELVFKKGKTVKDDTEHDDSEYKMITSSKRLKKGVDYSI